MSSDWTSGLRYAIFSFINLNCSRLTSEQLIVYINILLCNYPGAVVYLSDGGPYHRGRDPIFVFNVQCRGTEANILQCPFSYFVGSHCSHDNDVAIECEG